MNTVLDPAAARRRFAAVTFLFWLPVGMYVPSQVLLFTERGMTLATVAALFAVHSFTVSALELPTGGLSDVLGRRPVLAAAGVLNLGALLLIALGDSVWLLVCAMLLLGSGRALSSGPAEAWYVDTVQASEGPGAELRTGLARGGTASAAALAAGTLIGGSLPLGLSALGMAAVGTVLPLSVPSLVGALVCAGYVAYVLAALPEPPRPPAGLRSVLRGVPATVLGGLRLGAGDAVVRRLLLTAGAAGAALATIELLTPGRAARLTGAAESGAVLFAVLACAGFAGTALGSHLAPWAARVTGSGERAVLATLGVSACGLLLLGATAASAGPAALAVAALGYALVYVGFGAAGPNENDLLHRRVTGDVRATALSVQSLALQLVGALAGLGVSVLPLGPLPWLLGGAILLAGALLWARATPVPSPPPTTAETVPDPTRRDGVTA